MASPSYPIRIVDVEPTFLASTRERVPWKLLRSTIPRLFDRVYAFLRASNVTQSGQNVCLYRRPSKDGYLAREGGVELLPQFYRVYATNMRDLGTPVYPRSFFAAVLAAAREHKLVIVEDAEELGRECIKPRPQSFAADASGSLTNNLQPSEGMAVLVCQLVELVLLTKPHEHHSDVGKGLRFERVQGTPGKMIWSRPGAYNVFDVRQLALFNSGGRAEGSRRDVAGSLFDAVE